MPDQSTPEAGERYVVRYREHGEVYQILDTQTGRVQATHGFRSLAESRADRLNERHRQATRGAA